MSIGDRLREERDRLGFIQEKLAELLGTTKKTVIDYEKGNTSPKADFLAALAGIGADVNYIVTGNRTVVYEPRSKYELNPEQMALLDNFEHCSEEDKRAIQRLALLAAKEADTEEEQKPAQKSA
ncbi:helix-turn-helix domain-containing protein [Methylomonas sp. EFPC1]|uniref:helix-turn-helix domain-containing protein n=1 Tax=Methylomonas sp. EFPC1 TaxID=2812647 RepID=UPI00196756A2|nr:helix-turn-helix domain-containing protein [Methylomonas sp. EFPC1]QSB02008.1 helix-turn-helix domain-containing protein [Methylomonas sp. EFPC1]